MILEFKTKRSLHQIAENIREGNTTTSTLIGLFTNRPSVILQGTSLSVVWARSYRAYNYMKIQFVGDFVKEDDKTQVLRGVLLVPSPGIWTALVPLMLGAIFIYALFVDQGFGIIAFFLASISVVFHYIKIEHGKTAVLNTIRDLLQTTSFKVLEK